MIWSTAYNLKSEHAISKNKLLATIPKLPNEWRLSFEVNPTDYSASSFASVLHMTIGGKGGKIVGERTPAIWFHKTKGILVSTAFGGKAAYSKYFKPLPTPGEWIGFEISQVLIESQYMFNITIGGQTEFNHANKKPVELDGVKVYSGSPWYENQKGSIKNLKIEIRIPPPCVPAGEP